VPSFKLTGLISLSNHYRGCQHDFLSVETQPWTHQCSFGHSCAHGFHLNSTLLDLSWLNGSIGRPNWPGTQFEFMSKEGYVVSIQSVVQTPSQDSRPDRRLHDLLFRCKTAVQSLIVFPDSRPDRRLPNPFVARQPDGSFPTNTSLVLRDVRVARECRAYRSSVGRQPSRPSIAKPICCKTVVQTVRLPSTEMSLGLLGVLPVPVRRTRSRPGRRLPSNCQT